jgi:hypothetical protein
MSKIGRLKAPLFITLGLGTILEEGVADYDDQKKGGCVGNLLNVSELHTLKRTIKKTDQISSSLAFQQIARLFISLGLGKLLVRWATLSR